MRGQRSPGCPGKRVVPKVPVCLQVLRGWLALDPGQAGVTSAGREFLEWPGASWAASGGLGTLGAESGGPYLQRGVPSPLLGC